MDDKILQIMPISSNMTMTVVFKHDDGTEVRRVASALALMKDKAGNRWVTPMITCPDDPELKPVHDMSDFIRIETDIIK